LKIKLIKTKPKKSEKVRYEKVVWAKRISESFPKQPEALAMLTLTNRRHLQIKGDACPL
jgi:hypothetical protein